jgi:hypothetical protein
MRTRRSSALFLAAVVFSIFVSPMARGEWVIEQLTHYGYREFVPQTNGTSVAWRGWELLCGSWDAFLYDGQSTTKVSDPTTSHGVTSLNLTDSHLFWSASDNATGQHAYEQIYRFDLASRQTSQLTTDPNDHGYLTASGPNACWVLESIDELCLYRGDTGAITQISNTGGHANAPRVSGQNVVWASGVDSAHSEVFYYNGTTGVTTQITNNDFCDGSPVVSGMKVAWRAQDPNGDGICLYDAGSGTTTRLSNNPGAGSLCISESTVTWVEFDYSQRYPMGFLFSHDFASHTTTQVTPEAQRYWQLGSRQTSLDGSNLAWSAWDGNDFEISFYDGNTQEITQITDNDLDDVEPTLNGTKLAWDGTPVGYSRPTDETEIYCATFVPEPSALTLLAVGAAAMALASRRRSVRSL